VPTDTLTRTLERFTNRTLSFDQGVDVDLGLMVGRLTAPRAVFGTFAAFGIRDRTQIHHAAAEVLTDLVGAIVEYVFILSLREAKRVLFRNQKPIFDSFRKRNDFDSIHTAEP
jgi:hypothetical protein